MNINNPHEKEILNALYSIGNGSIDDITNALSGTEKPKNKRIKTSSGKHFKIDGKASYKKDKKTIEKIVESLIMKGVIKHQKDGGGPIYSPTLSQKETTSGNPGW
jgi:predicted transcriptional regulator